MSGPENMAASQIEPALEAAIQKLIAYCRAESWAGYDPYDACNSAAFDSMPFLNNRLPRLVLTQLLKRSPVNLRPLLRIPKAQNPKALGLFLSSFLKLSQVEPGVYENLIDVMISRLVALRSDNQTYWCWGYSFPWQTRTISVPSWAPNLVCTVFVADSLLSAYELQKDPQCLGMALSAADYILKQLYWTEGPLMAGFAYPVPSVRTPVHNANILAAALLCRAYQYTGEARFLKPALKAARYSASRQHADGSWAYGEGPSQGWIDNFHTGYNLCGLQSISNHLGTSEFDACILRGFEFYRSRFFRPDGAPRYFHDKTYPIDIHCVAQSIITLLAFRHLKPDNSVLARAVFGWALKHMWNQKGFFYYRVLRTCTIRTPYMRWSQAWMLEALATLLTESTRALRQPCSVKREASLRR